MTDAEGAASEDLTAAIGAVYDANGAARDDGPRRIYDQLAVTLLDAASTSYAGVSAVDAGAGTGAATAELLRRGARVVAVDLSAGMLRRVKKAGRASADAIAGNIVALPLRDAVADVAVAAFVLNHLPNPVDGLRELARVTRPSGWVLASTFGGQRPPVKVR